MKGLEQFGRVASEELELSRGSRGAASAGRACPWAKVPLQAAEARDFANRGPGAVLEPHPRPCQSAARRGVPGGGGSGGRSLGSRGTSRLEVWRVSQEPIVSFRSLREGVGKQDGNRIGCGVTQTGTFLKVAGAGSACSVVQFLWDTSSALSSLPPPMGRVSNTSEPQARSPSEVCCEGARGRASLSLLLLIAFVSFKY